MEFLLSRRQHSNACISSRDKHQLLINPQSPSEASLDIVLTSCSALLPCQPCLFSSLGKERLRSFVRTQCCAVVFQIGRNVSPTGSQSIQLSSASLLGSVSSPCLTASPTRSVLFVLQKDVLLCVCVVCVRDKQQTEARAWPARQALLALNYFPRPTAALWVRPQAS